MSKKSKNYDVKVWTTFNVNATSKEQAIEQVMFNIEHMMNTYDQIFWKAIATKINETPISKTIKGEDND